LKFALTAKDDKGAESNNPAIITITVKHINRPPMANAGTDQTVNAGYIVSLDGSKSKDPDNDPLTYSWKQVGGPSVVLNGADTSIATFTAPTDISSDTDMTFELTVTDSKNATNSATVKVTAKYVPPPNQLPTANAGSDQTVNAGDTVTLDGSGSRDPDGNITSYSWMQTAGPLLPAATLSDPNIPSPTFTAPSVSYDTTLKFSLTVKDDKGAASNNPAIVSVTVKAAAPSGNMTSAEGGGNMTSTAAPLPSSDATTLNSKGIALENQGKYAEAITYYDRALAIDPNNKFALSNKGNALDSLGKYAEAITYYDRALAIDPGALAPKIGKQNALSKMGR
jgi:Tetratricopeptide repeat/PKD domain